MLSPDALSAPAGVVAVVVVAVAAAVVVVVVVVVVAVAAAAVAVAVAVTVAVAVAVHSDARAGRPALWRASELRRNPASCCAMMYTWE